jgi:tRNA threonylcarbamoyladenosine biosynthesis protein TsaB
MRILAFDCAGAQCAAAIRVGNETVAAQRVESERGHAQLLMPLLIGLAGKAGIAFRDFDRFAVTTGPGSFTGIRVALAAARGLAIGTGKPAVGVTVFEVLAAGAAEAGVPTPRLLVAIESRRSECFLQVFDAGGRALGSPAMLAPEAIGGWIGPGPIAVAGDAAGKVVAAVPAAIDLGARFHATAPETLARLAAERSPDGAPKPFYLRPPDAVPTALRQLGHG